MNPCQTKEQVAAYMAKCAPHRKDYTEDEEDAPIIRRLSDGTEVEVVRPFNGNQPPL